MPRSELALQMASTSRWLRRHTGQPRPPLRLLKTVCRRERTGCHRCGASSGRSSGICELSDTLGPVLFFIRCFTGRLLPVNNSLSTSHRTEGPALRVRSNSSRPHTSLMGAGICHSHRVKGTEAGRDPGREPPPRPPVRAPVTCRVGRNTDRGKRFDQGTKTGARGSGIPGP